MIRDMKFRIKRYYCIWQEKWIWRGWIFGYYFDTGNK